MGEKKIYIFTATLDRSSTHIQRVHTNVVSIFRDSAVIWTVSSSGKPIVVFGVEQGGQMLSFGVLEMQWKLKLFCSLAGWWQHATFCATKDFLTRKFYCLSTAPSSTVRIQASEYRSPNANEKKKISCVFTQNSSFFFLNKVNCPYKTKKKKNCFQISYQKWGNDNKRGGTWKKSKPKVD